MYSQAEGLYVAHSQEGPVSIIGKMANRHGLIAGATGTGKTVTLQVLAETFSQAGVPCFMADMKGDLSGIGQDGKLSGFIEKRMTEFGIKNVAFGSCPVQFFDVYGEQGHPMRTTISNMGPQLLGRLMGLNEVQSGVLDIVFKVADDRNLLILDLKDLRSMLCFVNDNSSELSRAYGNITSASIGAIQRAVLSLETQGAEKFFGEPSFDINDLFRTRDGKGVMSVLAADKLMLNPKLYSTFLLWLLSDIYATLPEVGDQDLPKLVFFFDEAHTMFDDTPKALVDKIEQVVRLIRSKGVGVYFVTQNPTDIPDCILGQLGNRIQHALRAYTPNDQKAVRAAAQTFRANPSFKTETAITELETGEALVSFLDQKGAPEIVRRARILFPLSQIGAISPECRKEAIEWSGLSGKYDNPIDRESAFEVLLAQSQAAEEAAESEVEEDSRQEERKPARAKAARQNDTSAIGKIGKAVLTAAAGAALTTVTRSAGKAAADAITGKKSKKKNTGKDIAGKTITNATSTALRTLARSILGSLVKF